MRDPAFLEALRARGVEVHAFEGRDTMLCCLDADALARRIGEALGPGEAPEAFLRWVLPPGRLAFWTSDRF